MEISCIGRFQVFAAFWLEKYHKKPSDCRCSRRDLSRTSVGSHKYYQLYYLQRFLLRSTEWKRSKAVSYELIRTARKWPSHISRWCSGICRNILPREWTQKSKHKARMLTREYSMLLVPKRFPVRPGLQLLCLNLKKLKMASLCISC